MVQQVLLSTHAVFSKLLFNMFLYTCMFVTLSQSVIFNKREILLDESRTCTKKQNWKCSFFQIKLLKGAGQRKDVWRGRFRTTGHFMPQSAHVSVKPCSRWQRRWWCYLRRISTAVKKRSKIEIAEKKKWSEWFSNRRTWLQCPDLPSWIKQTWRTDQNVSLGLSESQQHSVA